MFVCVYIYIASFFLLIGHLHSGDVPNVCFRVFKEVSVEYIHTSGSWLVVMVGCHGWLLWLVVMVGCHGWLLWLSFTSEPLATIMVYGTLHLSFAR